MIFSEPKFTMLRKSGPNLSVKSSRTRKLWAKALYRIKLDPWHENEKGADRLQLYEDLSYSL